MIARRFGTAFYGLLALSLLLAGCGGGGGGGGGGNVVALVSLLRAVQVGDSVSYRITGDVSSNGQKTGFSGTGTYSVSQGNINGNAVFVATLAGTVSGGGQQIPLNVAEFFTQDANRNLIFQGDNSGPNDTNRFLSTPNISVPGTFDPSSSFTTSYQFTNGEVEQESFNIVSVETVTVPAGTFEAWKVVESSSDATSQSTSTLWYAPQLGTFVKGTGVSTEDGVTQTLTLEMISTNIPF